FEFTNCEAFYNGQKLPFMQPLSEWVKIFGPYDTRKNHFFTWHNIPMDVAIKDYQDSLVVQMSMQFGKNTLDDNDSLNKFKGSILINNLPFWKGVVIEKFNSQLKKDPSIPVFLPSSYTKFNRASICADSLILVQTITLEFSDRSNIKRFDMWVRYQLD
ncbi:MAG: hypothetical protein JXB34_13290, partial [Bacteroidales bacterium]|nr:hypothetical protein [Bacteroidales bacterium]